MRKFLIKNFVLGTWIVLFGKSIHTLRAPRVILPVFVAIGLFIVSDPSRVLDWYDFILLGILAVWVDFGFSFFPFSYFSKYPPEFTEMDEEQKHDYLRGIKLGKVKNYLTGKYGELSVTQEMNFLRLARTLRERKINKRFAGLGSLIPLALTLIAIIIWYLKIDL